jgi:uncharacterized membrane protein
MSTGNNDKPHRVELLIGLVLRVGVGCSVALILAGFAWRCFATGSLVFDYAIERMNFFEFLLADIRGLGAPELRPRVLVNLGIGVLLLTPYLRVLTSLVYFATIERDPKYTAFTMFVFVVLTYSLLLG